MNLTKKRYLYIGLLSSLSSLTITGCHHNLNYKPAYSKDINHLERFSKTILEDGMSTLVYDKNYLFVTMNRNTREFHEYICNNNPIYIETYDLNTGDLIYYADISHENTEDREWYMDNVLSGVDIIPLRNVSDEIVDQYKFWYSFDDIKDLEDKILKLFDYKNSYVLKREKKVTD